MTVLMRLFDEPALEFIQNSIRSPFMDGLMTAITYLGSAGFVWIITAAVFACFKKYRTHAAVLIAALLLGQLLGNVILKPLVGRVRPSNINMEISIPITRPADFSFPSGHALSSFAAAFVIFRSNRRFGAFAFPMAALIAFSRVYLYVHYPTDVLGGAAVGIAVGFIAARLHDVIIKKVAKA